MRQQDLELFRGKRILVVEDDYLMAEDVRRQLLACGALIAGPVPSVSKGLALVEDGGIDAAILDIGLDGETAFPIADRLHQLGIPFVFASGQDRRMIPGAYQGYVLCEKPAELAVIAVALFAPSRFQH